MDIRQEWSLSELRYPSASLLFPAVVGYLQLVLMTKESNVSTLISEFSHIKSVFYRVFQT